MIRISGKDRKTLCSFCLEDNGKVRPLVAGPNDVFICGNCVSLLASIIAGHYNEIADSLQKRADDSPPIPTDSPSTQGDPI